MDVKILSAIYGLSNLKLMQPKNQGLIPIRVEQAAEIQLNFLLFKTYTVIILEKLNVIAVMI